jgi:RND family efflux transporter MFP subunit
MKRRVLLFLAFSLPALSLLAQTSSPIIANGVVTPIEEATLGAKVKGIIEKFRVEEGAAVTNGQVLVELDHNLEELDVQQRDVIRQAARLAAEKSRRDYENGKKLWDTKAISEDEFRKVDLQYQIDQRQAEQGEISFRSAQQRLEDKFIRSPFDGYVVRKLKQRGEPVDELEKIIRVVNVSRLNLVIYLDGKFLPRVKLGQGAQIQCTTMGTQKAAGTVAVMDPIVDAASGQFRVKIQFDNPGNEIKAGIPGTATLVEDGTQSAAK